MKKQPPKMAGDPGGRGDQRGKVRAAPGLELTRKEKAAAKEYGKLLKKALPMRTKP